MRDSHGNSVLKPDILSIDYGVSTHIGQRAYNQDKVLVTNSTKSLNGEGQLFAVADGMGGHPGGGIASRMACKSLKNLYEKKIKKLGTEKPADVSQHLVEAVIRIDRSIRLKGLRNDKLEDMGTTLSCLAITPTHSVIAHVGDSRIYRLRNGHLTCLTVDHTFVKDMIFEGEVDPGEAHLHPLRHMLTMAVGAGEPLAVVDTRHDLLNKKDRFLLCTDGLYNAINEKNILTFLTCQSNASEIAERIVMQASINGARDNITAIVIKVKKNDKVYCGKGK